MEDRILSGAMNEGNMQEQFILFAVFVLINKGICLTKKQISCARLLLGTKIVHCSVSVAFGQVEPRDFHRHIVC